MQMKPAKHVCTTSSSLSASTYANGHLDTGYKFVAKLHLTFHGIPSHFPLAVFYFFSPSSSHDLFLY